MIILTQSLIISFFCIGLRISMEEGMILESFRKPYTDLLEINEDDLNQLGKISYIVLKPIVGCITCMSSFWTLILSYFYFSITPRTILVIFIVAGLNSILYKIYEK